MGGWGGGEEAGGLGPVYNSTTEKGGEGEEAPPASQPAAKLYDFYGPRFASLGKQQNTNTNTTAITTTTTTTNTNNKCRTGTYS